MPRYEDYAPSEGTLDSHDRYDRYSRGPPVAVAERPRHVEERFEGRFEDLLDQNDRYQPPARASGILYDDDHLDHPSPPGSVISHERRRRRDDSPSFEPPKLLRRQSSLDTFDRIPRHKLEHLEMRDRVPPVLREPALPRHHPSAGRYRDREIYDDISIAEPDYYGDEEFRDLRDRDMAGHRRRSSSHVRKHHEEKPYPRKGKTRVPRHLANGRAILELGYPFKEEHDVIVIQKALSKAQIDEVVNLSREFNRRSRPAERARSRVRAPAEHVSTEFLNVGSPPRSSRPLIIERSPSRQRSRSRSRRHDEYYEYEEVVEVPQPSGMSRRRAVSVHDPRSSGLPPVQYVGGQTHLGVGNHHHRLPEIRPRTSDHGLMVVSPRRGSNASSDYMHSLEEEIRLLHLERKAPRPNEGITITRTRDVDLIDDQGHAVQATEVRKREQSQPNRHVMRAMMATLT